MRVTAIPLIVLALVGLAGYSMSPGQDIPAPAEDPFAPDSPTADRAPSAPAVPAAPTSPTPLPAPDVPAPVEAKMYLPRPSTTWSASDDTPQGAHDPTTVRYSATATSPSARQALRSSYDPALRSLEAKSLQMAAALRGMASSDTERRDRASEQLRETLEQIFDARMKTEQAKVDQLRNRLQAVEEKLATREENRTLIIDRRLAELSGDASLDWDPQSSSTRVLPEYPPSRSPFEATVPLPAAPLSREPTSPRTSRPSFPRRLRPTVRSSNPLSEGRTKNEIDPRLLVEGLITLLDRQDDATETREGADDRSEMIQKLSDLVGTLKRGEDRSPTTP